MADGAPPQRLQEIFTALVQKSIADSLGRVEQALASCRRGERNVLAVHAEVLRHAARTNVLSNRIARAALEGPDTLLRDALDAAVIGREEARQLLGRDPEGVAPSPSLDEEAARTAGPEMPAKRSTMEKLLRDGPVLAHLDPRRPGPGVPAEARGGRGVGRGFGFGLAPADRGPRRRGAWAVGHVDLPRRPPSLHPPLDLGLRRRRRRWPRLGLGRRRPRRDRPRVRARC